MEREITYEDVLMFIIKNKDNEKMMADLNRTTFAFTARYKNARAEEMAKSIDSLIIEETRKDYEDELISRWAETKDAIVVSKMRCNMDDFKKFVDEHWWTPIWAERNMFKRYCEKAQKLIKNVCLFCDIPWEDFKKNVKELIKDVATGTRKANFD